MQKALAKIHENKVKLGMTILIVEQNVALAMKVTDHTVEFINGDVPLIEENPIVLLNNRKLKKLFMGKPCEEEVNP